MNSLWFILFIVFVLVCIMIYQLVLKDIFNFVLETNDDVEDFKESIEKENGS